MSSVHEFSHKTETVCLGAELYEGLVEKIISFELFYHKILFIYHWLLVLVQAARSLCVQSIDFLTF